MQLAGYHWRANDLTYEEWLDLGDVKAALPTRDQALLTTIMQMLTGLMGG
ncbi:MAG: hypothetical protein ABFS18_02170 [Thermodesulfobacteriota bacterium]